MIEQDQIGEIIVHVEHGLAAVKSPIPRFALITWALLDACGKNGLGTALYFDEGLICIGTTVEYRIIEARREGAIVERV